jgi:hypothetical protein
VEAWKTEESPLFMSLPSNAELVVRESPASKDVNTEVKEAAALEAVTRQPVKTRKTEMT